MDFMHIWDMERVHIKVKPEFLEKINMLIFKKFKTKRNAHKYIFKNSEIPFTTFKNILKNSYIKNYFVPFNVYELLCSSLGISRESLERNVISYKTANGRNIVSNPVLPIKIIPIFDMVLAHNFGDGTVINCRNGRLPYFGYRQFDGFYRVGYIRKIESIFGKISFEKDYFNATTRPYCPSSLSSLFFKYYNLGVEDFLSDKARVPILVFQRGKDSMLSFLIAFIIDEGNIDSTDIFIKLKNILLIEDLKKICDLLGYRSKIIHGKGELRDFAFLYILREGVKKLYRDYISLNTKYPVIDLGIKGEKIGDSFKIYNREIYKSKGNRDIILSILDREYLTVNQLALRMNMTRQGVRFHIHSLLKEGKIRLIDKNQPNWVYGV